MGSGFHKSLLISPLSVCVVVCWEKRLECVCACVVVFSRPCVYVFLLICVFRQV